MFDANLRYLPKGQLYIADVESLRPNSVLKRHGIKQYDKVLGIHPTDPKYISTDPWRDEDENVVSFIIKDRKIIKVEDESVLRHKEWLVFDRMVRNPYN